MIDVKFLKQLENSKLPADRLYYAKSVKRIIEIGEQALNFKTIKTKKEIKSNLNNLKSKLENYEIYTQTN